MPASPHDFAQRHLGPRPADVEHMLQKLGCDSLEDLLSAVVPANIRLPRSLNLPEPCSEAKALAELKAIASQNQVLRSYLGQGYANCLTPPVIQRNILENPGWYTAYTPYQAEIAQGRLEALLNFQTMVSDLTGLEIANASLLDEGTAAAEAMTLSLAVAKSKSQTYFVAHNCHPQTIAVVQTRAAALGIEVLVGDPLQFDFQTPIFGLLLQYPATDGTIADYRSVIEQAHAQGAIATVACDLLALTLLTPPGEFGADIAVGNSQRFGVPLGYGGPHAAFFATKEAYKRQIPGRIVGVSKDAQGNPALRLALQTREQHIRRDKATSNICTAQVLLAVVAGFYAVYHGAEGLTAIARQVRRQAQILAEGLQSLGFKIPQQPGFDTLIIEVEDPTIWQSRAEAAGFNLRYLSDRQLGISLDETTTNADLADLLVVFAQGQPLSNWEEFQSAADGQVDPAFARQTPFLTHPVFQQYHSETELLRYIHRLQSRDLSLTTAMIPLGSCTMKLNATAEMLPISWLEFNQIHPFAPLSQTQGYQQLFQQLENWLAEITGFDAVSLQPNAGSQGEYAGLLVIQRYHQSRGEGHRQICLIPQSAHGTNPASAVMAGMKVVPIACDDRGNIDVSDLQQKAAQHADQLAALMVTYPSTHGVFEEAIAKICAIVHQHGGQVYLDGANLNAQVGLCQPGQFGADVCHLNLHKTFCIPHGGGGPGVGPIGVAAHLTPFLPSHPLVPEVNTNPQALGPIAAAPWGSASILPISWMYIRMMGAAGLTQASAIAILNANYIATRLAPYYPILYRGDRGFVAHECILDLRPLKRTAGIEVEDVAKRLMDYGFHAPTMSWPVLGTLMVEPTESESLAELDRFCEAMIGIYHEVEAIASGDLDPLDNPLKQAPHTAAVLLKADWTHAYSREQAAYPASWTREYKFWPVVSRIDNAYGDRNLVCSCLPMSAYSNP
ncbi:aminomethyl-transferring glycine dehydrogenase [Synechococcus elongatus IITB7]|uniref:aminomethyl-transferring glycine dehydrogenase n=1 Tax=Synechococcus elongatus TaxID=32046 RepID=UPI0030CDC593